MTTEPANPDFKDFECEENDLLDEAKGTPDIILAAAAVLLSRRLLQLGEQVAALKDLLDTRMTENTDALSKIADVIHSESSYLGNQVLPGLKG